MIETLIFPPFRLEASDERLWHGSEPVALRPKTYAVLQYLAERPGRLVRNAELLDSVWAGTIVTPGTLNTSIRELRKALGDDARQPRFIETVHRRGFRFVADVSGPESDAQAERVASSFVPVPIVPTVSGIHGRDDDLERLDARLDAARRGIRQIVLVTGEVGIGKTSLLRAFADRHAQDATAGGLSIAWGTCVYRHGESEPFAPVLEALERLIRAARDQDLPEMMKRFAPTWVAQLPWLLDDEELADVFRSLGAVSPSRMLREFHVMTEAMTRNRPLVLFLEDVHWSDPATVDLIAAQARRTDPARLLLIASYRPVDAATTEHPIAPLHRSLRHEGSVDDLVLRPLTEESVDRYLCQRFEWQTTPTGLSTVIHDQTDGNPLLMVTLTSHLASNQLLAQSGGEWRLTVEPEALTARAPEGLQEIVDDQLEHLDREEREALEVASVIGDSFAAQTVAAGLNLDTTRLESTFGRLAQWGQFIDENGVARWPDGTEGRRFDFQHSAFRRILYGRLSPARRRLLHLRIAQGIESGYGEDLDPMVVQLALHYEQGGDVPSAVRHLVRAVASARRRFARGEAASFSRRAIQLLATDAEYRTLDRHESELRLELGQSIASLVGVTDESFEAAVSKTGELGLRLGGKADVDHGTDLPEAVDRLTEQQKRAVVLRYVSGRSFSDIARLTGTPRETVVARVLEGLRSVRDGPKINGMEGTG